MAICLRTVMWGHPHYSSPSSIQFSAWQHDNTLSLSIFLQSFSLCNPSLHSQLQTECSFPSLHLNTSIHSTSHAYQICQLTNGRADRTAINQYKNGHVSSLRSVNTCIKKKQHHERTHQDRRYNARLPGHVASGTGHTTTCQSSCNSNQHQSQPPQLHRGPPANQLCSQWFNIACGLPEASSWHGNAALDHS